MIDGSLFFFTGRERLRVCEKERERGTERDRADKREEKRKGKKERKKKKRLETSRRCRRRHDHNEKGIEIKSCSIATRNSRFWIQKTTSDQRQTSLHLNSARAGTARRQSAARARRNRGIMTMMSFR